MRKAITPITDSRTGITDPTTQNLQNANNRFRDPYENKLRGFMGVIDYSYGFNIGEIESSASLAVGFASGDNNPNKSLQSLQDYAQNSVYEGFVGIQEIYTGKRVRSVFMLSGVGKIPRILDVPGRVASGVIEYPSAVNRFTNIAYGGSALDGKFESDNFKWRLNPNLIFYWQPEPPRIFDQLLVQRLDKSCVSPFLGTELNLFLEARPVHLEGVQFFLTATLFFPGMYYQDITGVPLDKRQQKYLDRINNNGVIDEYVPTVGSDTAFYIMAGMEYRF